MPECWSSEQVIHNRAKLLVEYYKDKHLPECDCKSTPLNQAECRCTGPEKLMFLEAWALDCAETEYTESIARITKSITS
jgi:hypothetical protein